MRRTRVYANWQATKQLRAYVEFHYADTSVDGGAYRPRAFDENFGDFLNGFVELASQDGVWKARVAYLDYASGDDGGADFTRYNHLFPWSHRFLGFVDAVQRSNIIAPNVQLTAKPSGTNWELLLWYYYFRAAERDDLVPSITATGNQRLASADLGHELDLTAKYSFGPRSSVLFGYSHFWRGEKLLGPRDADFTYGQWGLNF